VFEGRVFEVDPALVAQRSSLSEGRMDVAGSEVTMVSDHGCGCEVAAFIGEHMTSWGWAA